MSSSASFAFEGDKKDETHKPQSREVWDIFLPDSRKDPDMDEDDEGDDEGRIDNYTTNNKGEGLFTREAAR